LIPLIEDLPPLSVVIKPLAEPSNFVALISFTTLLLLTVEKLLIVMKSVLLAVFPPDFETTSVFSLFLPVV
jgi:hypothetical protein